MVIWLFCKYKNNLKGLKPFMESALIFFFFKLLADSNNYFRRINTYVVGLR